ncbi:mandelate racemase/muconate lactonizing enzyme family protein [Streptomyces turgidiscabies]|uniref:Dipeptide epimerase n=2 Tax=Streptomyces TaxID=1883 RepID=L7F6P4_STRT8|nr:dipeptide epimerase [Streptomyces turgidiscabies]ELP66789.1 mandelate racemase/muconate lactonizing enzyme, C-terminal domain protein [Streptomyces turgidiscabies Car8]MDX3495279.1 dipeptide epimerase [Streptomyces turgidiscabies]GAQ71156.1 L-Ala-D/L-Glu epimerase [Streptomyces turgidiscabies]
MKASLRTVRLELAEPLRISRSTMAARDAVWLSIEHEESYGHGEAVTSLYYGLDADALRRHLIGVELSRYAAPEDALEALREGELARGDSTPAAVIAAVEAALLDLVGKRAGVPVHQLLGASAAPVAVTARTIGITSARRAADEARRLAARGFRIIKVKAGTPDPEDDVERVRVIRDAAPGLRLLLDPNGAWNIAQARELLPRFADLGVEAVEQPVAPGDPEGFGALAEKSPLPLIADEDAVDLEDARRLAGRVHGINVKLAKCGGVHAALRIAGLIEGSGTELMLGCLTASTLGIAPAVHLTDRARWIDLDGHLLLARDPWSGIGGADGVLQPSGRPGLGVEERGVEQIDAGQLNSRGLDSGDLDSGQLSSRDLGGEGGEHEDVA